MGLFFGRRKRRRSSRRQRLPIIRFFGPAITTVGLLSAAGTWLMGGIDFSSLDPSGDAEIAQAVYQNDGDGPTPLGEPVLGSAKDARPVARRNRGARRIRIATFNIKQFGPKKASNPVVMDWIARLVSRFDVIALQEVHGGDAEPIRALINQLQSGGADYAATVSEKIGNSDRYRESYAFLWNERTIRMIAGSDYVVADPGKRMAREPMACSFESIVPPEENRPPFSFTLINAHTSPSQVAENASLNEMDVLDDVYLSIADYSARTMAEDDVLLLGDLNVDSQHLRELGQLPNVTTVIGLEPTNMKGTKTYDHIVLNTNFTEEYTGKFGVVDVVSELKITPDQADSISDHRPVWAEFTATESGARIASTTRIIR